MASYKTPGVYVQEIQSLPASVAAVNTAVPVFIGVTDSQPSPNEPVKIANMADFEESFGGPHDFKLEATVTDERSADGDTLISRDIQLSVPDGSGFPFYLYAQLQMYFANGGGDCYIYSIAEFSDYDTTGAVAMTETVYDAAFDALEKEDEPTLIICTDPPFARAGTTDPVIIDFVKTGQLVQNSLIHAHKMGDRFVIADAAAQDISSIDSQFRNNIGTNYLDYGAAYYPYLKSTLGYSYSGTSLAIGASGHTITGTGGSDQSGNDLDTIKTNENSLYNDLIAAAKRYTRYLGPAGAIAGVYCATDRNRGVWKAPANVSLANVVEPSFRITQSENDGLNEDSNTGKSINAIRSFTGKGTLVWGARTLAGNSAEWRYVSVRRLFLMVEESVKKATEAIVFEPNDNATWLQTKGMIQNFLNGIWRDGGLQGSKPSQAYFVNVGLGTTMTAQDVLEGRMIIEIGMAAVRPAEFIVLKFSHKLAEA